MVLLHLLGSLRSTFPFDLDAVHVHHGLSPKADDWADFCARQCAAAGIALAIHRVRVARDDPDGIEAAARRARQQIFAQLETDWLLTAHHRDDQAETLLLQLLRGAGVKGLAGMPEMHPRPGWHARHLRPLLAVTRDELRHYAEMQGIAWQEDDSNRDPRFRRNALRHILLPHLEAHFPGAAATLARASMMQADASLLLDELAQRDASGAIHAGQLDCAVLTRLSDARARNLLRYFIEQQGHTLPSARRLNEILRQLRDARTDAHVRLRLERAELVRFRGQAQLIPLAPPVESSPLAWQGEPALWIPAARVTVVFEPVVGQGLKRSLLDSGKVTLGTRQGGERLQLHPGGPHRSLKNLMQEHAIPPWQRDHLALLWCDGQLVWADGIGQAADAAAAAGEAGIQPRVWAHPPTR